MVRLIAIASFCAATAVVSVAAAQAPIVYAARDNAAAHSQSTALNLLGGGEGSYGYGAETPGATRGAIDLRVRSAEESRAGVEPARHPTWLDRERVGPPYEANGRTYVPTAEPGYAETGVASWYGPQFHGRNAANGEVFDQHALTAAHPTLPLNSLVQVTNLQNGRELIVRITDRGPFVRDRLIDLSLAGARALDFEDQGHARVHVRYLGPAPRRVAPQGDIVASAEPPAAQAGPVSLLPAPAQPRQYEQRAQLNSTEGHYVQIGAFSDLTNAHRARDQAAAAGPVVVDVRSTGSGAELFRVSVGPLASAAAASDAQSALAALGFAETIIASR